MELCEVSWLEIPKPHQCDSHRIADSEGCGGRRCRGEIQRACLTLHTYPYMNSGMACEELVPVPTHADNWDMLVLQPWYEAEQLVGVA